ncbi:MAG: lipoate--protein ligase family protein [Verrucomicrobiae bacterium]|nr:lipoate--protein ligase family protein [Verrucomicrobiae bacterium]
MARVIHHDKNSPAYNMAVDEALLRLCQTPVLRIYQWNEPAVSLGYFQSKSVVPPGRSFVRRLTGGGLVDHANDFTYTLIFPRNHSLAQSGTSESYRKIHEAIQKALSHCHITSQVIPAPSELESSACFQKPVKFDLVNSSGQKIAGAAQRRTQLAVLHQGSLLINSLPTTFFSHLIQAVEEIFEKKFQSDQLTEEEIVLAKKLEKERYSLKIWNEMR